MQRFEIIVTGATVIKANGSPLELGVRHPAGMGSVMVERSGDGYTVTRFSKRGRVNYSYAVGDGRWVVLPNSIYRDNCESWWGEGEEHDPLRRMMRRLGLGTQKLRYHKEKDELYVPVEGRPTSYQDYSFSPGVWTDKEREFPGRVHRRLYSGPKSRVFKGQSWAVVSNHGGRFEDEVVVIAVHVWGHFPIPPLEAALKELLRK